MLPQPHARWLEGLLGALPPEEKLATCDTCPMLAEDPFDAPRFPAATKCCTFMPDLPSFQVGALLQNPDPALSFGRERVLARILAGRGVTPLGVTKPRAYANIYEPGAFGQSEALRCPYYVDGGCGIWPHREGVCSTWFCRHERGMLGATFWRTTTRLLKGVENVVARWLAVAAGIEHEALAGLSNSDVDREEHPEYYESIWGRWAGEEPAYYVDIANRVADVRWDQVAEWADAATSELADEAKAAFAELGNDDIPDVLLVGRLVRLGETATMVRLASYSPYHPLDVPRKVVDALRDQDGKPTAALAERGLSREDVRRLIDHEILVPAPK